MRAYDPEGVEQAKSVLENVEFMASPYEAADGADGLAIVTEWDEFRALDLKRLAGSLARPILVDLRNIYSPDEVEGAGASLSRGRAAVRHARASYKWLNRQPVFERDIVYRAPFSAQWRAELKSSLKLMWRVISAIMLREARTRYGASNLGYTWALIDPTIQLAIWIAMFAALGRTTPIPVPLPAFLLVAIIPFFFWRGTFARAATAVRSNANLIEYPQVTPSDVIIGRLLLEATTGIAVFLILSIFLAVLGGIPITTYFDDPAQLLLALLTFLYFSVGTAFFSSALGRILPVWGNIQNYLSRPLYIFSGIFFHSLPAARHHSQIYGLQPDCA